MATKRIDSGWTISCGIWPPFLMPTLADVHAALREQGILRREPAGLDALHDQWVYAQRWTYAARFDCGGEDERFHLRFEHMAGSGEARLNGRTLGRFQPGEWMVDVTGACEPEGNELEIVFDPSLPNGAPRGILGPVWLRETSYVELTRVRADMKDGAIRVRFGLTAHTAGRFLFKYQVSLDGEMVSTVELYERLKASQAQVEHALKLPPAVAWDGEKYYTVRLMVERSGVACDSALLNVSPDAPDLRRVAKIPARQLSDQGLLRALRELGAQAVWPEGMDARELGGKLLLPGLLADGLRIAEGPDCPEDRDLLALPDLRQMERMAGGDRFWPAGAPVWRATGSPCPDKQSAEALYGANALGDAGRYARLSRFVQAEAVQAISLNARRERHALSVNAIEDSAAYASTALIECSGRRRPAFAALRQVWGGCAAFELPEPFKAKLPLKVWLYPGGAGRRPVTVTASLYRLDGTLVASTSFTAMPGEGEPTLLGELKATLPEEGIVIARAELSDGGKTSRIDQVICLVRPGTPKRGMLLNPPRSELRLSGGELICTGPSAALGVTAGGFYGALLPGEKIALPGGIVPEDIESLNGQIL